MRYAYTSIVLIIPMLVALAALSAHAQDITLSEPRAGATVDDSTRFAFNVNSGDLIENCSLIVDGQVTKTAQYDDYLRTRTLSFAMIAEEGNHTWNVECETPNGKISAEAVPFTLKLPENPVKVLASGAVRGSMVHIFKMRNDASQAPIMVPKIATGDYIEVSLVVPPSTIKKEFYVRSRLTKDGKPILWLTAKQENYYLPQGENVTVNMTGSSRVIMSLDGIVNNRANVIVYPAVKSSETPTAEVPDAETDETPNDQEQPGTQGQEQQGSQQPDGQGEAPTPPADAPKPGLFKRFMGWLSGIFG